MGEVGEFLRTVGDRDVERDAPRRKAVLPEFADGAEIGRAEESHPVVLAPVQFAPARLLDAKPGEARALRQLMGRRIGRHVEIGLLVDDLARLVALDHVHADRLLEEEAEVEEGDRERSRAIGEKRVLVAEADLPPFFVIDPLENVGHRPGRRLIGRVRPLLGLLLEEFVGERLGRIELQALRIGAERLANRRKGRGRKGDPLQNRPPIHAVRHSSPFATPSPA